MHSGYRVKIGSRYWHQGSGWWANVGGGQSSAWEQVPEFHDWWTQFGGAQEKTDLRELDAGDAILYHYYGSTQTWDHMVIVVTPDKVNGQPLVSGRGFINAKILRENPENPGLACEYWKNTLQESYDTLKFSDQDTVIGLKMPYERSSQPAPWSP